MAKMRGIKPGFFTSDGPSELSIEARFLLIGLWTLACDRGHVEMRPKQIKRRIMPDDDVNCAELLREIGESECADITPDGMWMTIRNFEHQKTDKRWLTTCSKPGCSDDSERETRRGHDGATQSTRRVPPRPRAEGEGEGEGEGEEQQTTSVVDAASAAPKQRRGTRLPADWTPDPELVIQMRAEGISDDLARRELPRFRDYWTAKPGKDATKLDWGATWRNWLRRAAEQSRPHGRPNAVQQAIAVHQALKAAEDSAAFDIPVIGELP